MLAPIQRCSPRLINRFDWERTAYPHGPNKDDLRFLWMVGLPPKNRHRELHPTRPVKKLFGTKKLPGSTFATPKRTSTALTAQTGLCKNSSPPIVTTMVNSWLTY
jgi:hypothetical protein